MVPDLSPTQPTVAVVVQFQHEIQVPQRDIPLAVHYEQALGMAAVHRQIEIGVAGRMRLNCCRAENQGRYNDQSRRPDLHFISPDAALNRARNWRANGSMMGSSSLAFCKKSKASPA